MNEIQPGEQPFSTSDAILAIALFLAGCPPMDEHQPCTNLFDAEILANLGYRGEKLNDAAGAAWHDEKKGHVQYHLKLTERTAYLIRAFREQSEEVEKLDGKAFDLLAKMASDFKAGAMEADEMILRFACINLKTRGQFVNLWKQMIPLLRVPVDGRAKHFDTTATVKNARGGSRTVQAQGVQRPGFKVISLNASEKTRKEMRL